jgi:hypothetical protein
MAGRRKSRQVQKGDVLAVAQSDGKFTPVYVMALWPRAPSLMLIALLTSELEKNLPPASQVSALVRAELERGRIFSVLSVPVNPAKYGEWPKVGEVADFNPDSYLPAAPFKTGSLTGSTYHSSPIVEALVEAFRGLRDWDAALPGRPGVLRSLLLPGATVH